MIGEAYIRIAMPDLKTYARKYIGSIDGKESVMPYSSAKLDGLSMPAAPFNIVVREHGHRFICDFRTHRAVLQRVGYKSITKCAFGEGQDPRLLGDAAHRPTESLYVEAQK